MKKTIMMIMLCCISIAFGSFGKVSSSKTTDDKIIKLSPIEWDAVKNCVDTNGYCHIKEQNVVLVITNGCPDVEHLLPVWNSIPETDLERNKLHMKDRRGKKSSIDVEPIPYVGQRTLQ